jgi:hypothetical protein
VAARNSNAQIVVRIDLFTGSSPRRSRGDSITTRPGGQYHSS